MRKFSLVFVSAALTVMALAGYCVAADNCNDCRTRKCDIATKIGWGLVNLIMAPAELVKGLTCAPDDRGMAYDLPMGLGHGFCNMAKRLGTGIYEVAPFTGPCMANYDPIGKECTSCDQKDPWAKDRTAAFKAAATEKK